MLDFASKVFVQESESLNGVLRFQSVADAFEECKREFLDQFDALNNWSKLNRLEQLMAEHGLAFEFVGDAQERYRFLKHVVTEPFKVNAPFFDGERELYPFQHAGMNLAYELDRVLINWDTGAGKTLLGSLVAQRLMDEGKIDIVVVLCERAKKSDWENYIATNTRLSVKRVEGAREKRHEKYLEWDLQVLVTNYEKFRYPREDNDGNRIWGETDLWQLLHLLEGKRVLFILDEATKIANASSLMSKGLRSATQDTKTLLGRNKPQMAQVRMVALTATPLVTDPFNIHDIMKTVAPGIPGVSETKAKFSQEYVDYYYGMYDKPIWKDDKLPMLGKRLERVSHVAMKSDPEIATQFPEMVERKIHLELSEEDRAVYEAIEKSAIDTWEDNNYAANLGNFNLLRMVCDTSESLRHSTSALAEQIVKDGPPLEFKNSAKYQAVRDLAERIINANEKLVLFSFFANAVIPQYMEALSQHFKNTTPIYRYDGSMRESEQDTSKDSFNNAKGGAILIVSDAGQKGLNLYAPYLAHIEMPYTYAAYKQRRDRIHRSDSHIYGIDHTWIYRFETEDTVEERIEQMVYQRREQSEAVAGRPDVNSSQESLTVGSLRGIMFGDRLLVKD